MTKKHNPLINTIEKEPFVSLENEDDFLGWDKEKEVVYNQISRQREKARFFSLIFDFFNDQGIIGDYHEYGCHRCRTFKMALTEARRQNQKEMKFFAFDSFEGMPAVERDKWNQKQWKNGALATAEKEFMEIINNHGIFVDKVKTIKGFYQESLTKELQKVFLNNENLIKLVTIDCDLYESALPVFDFIEPLLQEGSVIYIDDLFDGRNGNPLKGVGRAFQEFQKKSKWAFYSHLNIGWWGRSYIVCKKGKTIEGII